MSNGFVRQSSGLIITGQVIEASHFNNEFNAIEAAFNGVSGHDHTGGTGMGPVIAPTGGGTPFFLGGTVSGTGNAIVIATTTPDTFALVDKYTVVFRPTAYNTGAVTINVNGTGAIPVKKVSPTGYNAMQPGDIVPDVVFVFIYDAANNVFQSLANLFSPYPIVTASGFTASIDSVFVKYVMTAVATIVLPSTITLPQWFTIEVQAKGGDITMTPDAADVIQGASAGVSFTIPQGTHALMYIGDDYKWYVNGTAITQPITTGGTGATTAAGARTNLGLVIGTNVQAYDADLAALAANSGTGLWAVTGAGTGSVRTITGTSSRLSVTNGDGVAGAPTLDIDAAYVGQTSITTLGTIGTGVWQGTTLAVGYGGTGQTTYTNGQLLIGNTTGNTLTKGTLTAPASGLSITGGTGTITFTLANDLSALEGLASTGIAVRTTTDTWAQRTITAGTNIAVTNGDGVSGNPTVAFTGTLPVANGGTGLATLTANNVVLGNGTSNVQFVAPGTSGNVLTSNGTTWTSAASSAPTITGFAKAKFTNTGVASPTINAGINIASITRTATGKYDIVFTSNAANANYTVSGTAIRTANPDMFLALQSQAVSGFTVWTTSSGGAQFDTDSFNIIVHT